MECVITLDDDIEPYMSLSLIHIFIPQVIEELRKLGRPDIIVTAGGVIPAQDYDFLYKAGVAAIFGPGTPVAYSAAKCLEILLGKEA